MSKKYKRQVRRQTGTTSAGGTSGSRTSSSSLPVFDPDYTYIIQDLRRIGMIAGSFIVFLVILSFILK